ncbi:MAG: D-glycero-beta-D-manno-heptose-7-phosphate kinase [Helicobacter sp.]|uniref:D-glycero-beta-D-manno-heptose-7-phosphate kinase n=1 Tax=Helicobacter sp. 10-6591 TaxID=2004998 RepID=UPI000DCC46E3|nr:D-glycero-beta-D-manno-heptose-7-phosphate kinase [Helicobacter sp. 10-6591]MCI6218364.1 D-glycero-beta-D-manno-heptose-7-phosphate kinase [Helicobacter sp.]MCI7484409.1 D-glycero-beta-D-manno-heptose-7-phosphate kinase [Helicobacter sp.]MDD7567295.1 D-glycero-beta-D-manno-heptose-7-phosphate kinase [Helicobacter sp.]MDY5741117.1 D-glycero-beta-D-manno-heptose-7-phosphate kinase [Helicobacter sp.]RAX55883.1 D-glycero-beta-D-manno-heptose-7-phosphate kinase [Helicobacter sp. 10-6591]
MFGLENKIPKILVVGDLMIDHYIWGDCDRISPEAPVQVVNVRSESNRLGGSCNVVNNLIALGAQVSVCGVIGDDKDGKWLVSTLESLNVKVDHIFVDDSRPTTKKSRVIVSHQQVLRVDRESKTKVKDTFLQKVRQDLELLVPEVDCVIISDYNKGLLDTEFTQYIITLARSENKLVLCDPKGNDYTKYNKATLLTPNKKEAAEATGIPITDDSSLLVAGLRLKKMCNLQISLITLSEDGIGVIDKSLTKIPTFAKEVYDVTGAGDTVIAALGFALSCGLDIYKASKFANAAAAIVVGKIGSTVATHLEIDRHLHTNISHLSHAQSHKISTKQQVKHAIDSLKLANENAKIVFTNGCFDILHRGHAQYLAQARELGDILIVGLNSDNSVTRLKGENRPINTQEDRAFLLASLECVDYVIIFTEDTPEELIKYLSPDILVKAKDYEGKQIAGSLYAKEVRLLDFVEGRSSSITIEKIAKSHT